MKTIIITGLLAFAMLDNADAQNNPFAKTAWKIENVSEDGSVLLIKTKMLKLPQEQAKFFYIQFENDKNYNSGTSCFSTGGKYEILDHKQISFNSMDAAATADCAEPATLSGTYVYEMNKEGIKLRPVAESEQQSNEEPYEAVDAGEVKEAGK